MKPKDIENLFPFEGTPNLNGKPYPEEDIDKIVNSFFEGKTPPKNRTGAHVKILLGAPGAGKSYNAAKNYDAMEETTKSQTIYVSYDENGAIYAIPGFKEKLTELLGHDFDQHDQIDTSKISPEQYNAIEAVWSAYRPLSQYIRSKILKRAAAEGYSMIIDTTSSSPGTLKMIEALNQADYGKSQIEIEGTYAPMEISRQRIEKRPRKASYLELVTKRMDDPAKNSGAVNMITPLIKAVGTFTYRFNPDNENPPRPAFTFKNGTLTAHDPSVAQTLLSSAESDEEYLQNLIPMVAEMSDENVEKLKNSASYAAQSTQGFKSFITNHILSGKHLTPAQSPEPN
ncbi:MAG: hypothetical protein R3E13_11220 [Alphaproteobacteria bacterium]